MTCMKKIKKNSSKSQKKKRSLQQPSKHQRTSHPRKRAKKIFKRNADDWNRTSTLLPRTDFESAASTNSATSAFRKILLCHIKDFHQRLLPKLGAIKGKFFIGFEISYDNLKSNFRYTQRTWKIMAMALAAIHPELQACCKLKPPVTPSTSRISPAK